MGYLILKYGRPLLTHIESLEETKKEALNFVSSTQSEYIEVQNSENETATIGYFDGQRFHWTKDKAQTEAWKGLTFVTEPPLWRGPSTSEGMILWNHGKKVGKMTWVKKGEKILAYELALADEAEVDYCPKCFKDSRPDGSSIIGYITKEDFKTKEGQTLLCDGCGKEIQPWA